MLHRGTGRAARRWRGGGARLGALALLATALWGQQAAPSKAVAPGKAAPPSQAAAPGKAAPPSQAAPSEVATPSGPVAEVHTLAEYQALAQRNRPEIRAAEAAEAAARERVTEARSGNRPRLGVAGGHAQQTYNFAAPPGTSPKQRAVVEAPTTAHTEPYYNLGATLDWPALDFGRTKAAVAGAEAGVAVAEHRLEQARLGVGLEVYNAYYGLLAAEELAAVQRTALANAQRHWSQAQAFFQFGRRPKIDVTLQDTAVANARFALLQADEDVDVQRSALATVTGIEAGGTRLEAAPPTAPGGMAAASGGATSGGATSGGARTSDGTAAAASGGAVSSGAAAAGGVDVETATYPELLKLADQRRPDLMILSSELLGAEDAVLAARANLRPRLDLSGFLSFRNLGFPLIYNFGMADELTQTLFESGLRHATLREFQQDQVVAQQDLAAARNSVRQDVFVSYADRNVALRKIAVARQAQRSAQESLALAEGRYQAGVGNVIELNDAELAEVSAASQVVEAEYALRLAEGRLRVAIGAQP